MSNLATQQDSNGQPMPTPINAAKPQFSQPVVFDGGAASYFVTGILAYLVTVFSLGICFPWSLCMVQKWKVNHTLIHGKRLRFVGSAWGLFGLWIKWFLLTAITFGIYSFWVIPSLQKWIAKNTVA